jgi:hypothetical protein
VRIAREGDSAVITHRDPNIAVTHFRLGPQLDGMTDEEVLTLFNASIAARDCLAAENPYVAKEIPPGQPQLTYSPRTDQWIPRGDVVRCVIDSDGEGQAVIYVDDHELSLEQFGRMLTTYAGWGMRIEFTPEDDVNQRPALEVREPE